MAKFEKIDDEDLDRVSGGRPYVLSNEHRKHVETTINDVKCRHCGAEFDYSNPDGIQWYSDLDPAYCSNPDKYIFANVRCPKCGKLFEYHKDGSTANYFMGWSKELPIIDWDF